jgi:hypothetical protein
MYMTSLTLTILIVHLLVVTKDMVISAKFGRGLNHHFVHSIVKVTSAIWQPSTSGLFSLSLTLSFYQARTLFLSLRLSLGLSLPLSVSQSPSQSPSQSLSLSFSLSRALSFSLCVSFSLSLFEARYTRCIFCLYLEREKERL